MLDLVDARSIKHDRRTIGIKQMTKDASNAVSKQRTVDRLLVACATSGYSGRIGKGRL
jgi:hypothetical protein